MLNMTRQQVTTLLTLFVCGLWFITAIVRIWLPFPSAYILDAAMPLVIGYYFVSKNGKENRNGVPAAT
jgi:hypothetical protein